jgi:hypothetical protein
MEAYAANRDTAVETVLEADTVAMAVLSLMSKTTRWEGTATDLLLVLAGEASDAVRREQKWPKNGRALSGRLRRAMPSLRECGITIEREREGKTRVRKLTISRVAEKGGNLASASSAASVVATNSASTNDLEVDTGRAQTRGADANGVDSARRNSLETVEADAVDEADTNYPPLSEPWRVDL